MGGVTFLSVKIYSCLVQGEGHSCVIFLAASFPERYTGIIGEGVFFSLCVIAFLCMVLRWEKVALYRHSV